MDEEKKQWTSFGLQCFSYGCYNYRNVKTKEAGITFHKFPNKEKYPDLYAQWVKNCRRVKEPSAHSRVCSAHFSEKYINRTLKHTVLKENAIPTIFSENYPHYLQPPCPKKRRTSTICQESQPKMNVQESIATDHLYFENETTLKDKIKLLEDKNHMLQKEARNAKLREKRAKQTCKTLINELKKQNLLSCELETRLAVYEEIPCDLFKKSSHEFSQEQRDFALTLHLYSPKAYDYLKKSSGLKLPEPRTLRRWLEKIDATPGINISMLNSLKQKLVENPADYTNCSLLIDAMAIRQKVEFDTKHQQFTGFVDLGHGPEEMSEAKEALVFMLVGLKGHWKAPVAYFLTRGLSAEMQAELLLHTISEVNELGLKVRCITLDGHATNIGMLRQLGCSLDLNMMKTSFQPSDVHHKIYVILDPCHMIKLVRNIFHSSTIISSDGSIKWEFVTKLHDLQQQLGLRLGNKLKSEHINFQSKKMKVSLATQVLSNSVATALQTTESLGLPDFAGCGPTTNFLKKIDKLFDVLNSRSLYGVGAKSAINLSKWPSVYSFFQEMTTYLTKLRTADGTPLHKTRRATSIVGLIANMSSIEGLIHDLLPEELQYLATYKFSQDHLELFFSAVRGCGGWNNNPTAKGLECIMRRLLARAGARMEPSTANVTRIDETDIVRVSTSSYVPCYKIVPREELHNPPKIETSVDIVKENILVYVAGWVARKVSGNVCCEQCNTCLFDTRSSISGVSCELLKNKDRGALTIPSKGVIEVIGSSEKHYRFLFNTHHVQHNMSSLLLERHVLTELGAVDIFKMNSHIRETAVGTENHYFDLLRLLVKTYFNLRTHHVCSLHNMSLQGNSKRQKLNKLILFSGQ